MSLIRDLRYIRRNFVRVDFFLAVLSPDNAAVWLKRIQRRIQRVRMARLRLALCREWLERVVQLARVRNKLRDSAALLAPLLAALRGTR